MKALGLVAAGFLGYTAWATAQRVARWEREAPVLVDAHVAAVNGALQDLAGQVSAALNDIATRVQASLQVSLS